MLDARIPAALAASMLLHAAALALVDRLPAGSRIGVPDWSAWSTDALQARLLARGEEPAPQPAAASPAPARRSATASPRYIPVEELDERPQIRTAVHPQFPAHAAAATGRVVLHLLLNESGAVDDVRVVSAEPAGSFEAAAREAFAPALFTPGRLAGEAVKSRLPIEVRFGDAPTALAQSGAQGVPYWQPPRRPRPARAPKPEERP